MAFCERRKECDLLLNLGYMCNMEPLLEDDEN